MLKIGQFILKRYNSSGRRKDDLYNGFQCIVDELEKKYPVDSVTIENINSYDYILIGFHSFMEIDDFIWTMMKLKEKRKCKIVAGGFYCLNIKLIYEYIDIAVFGRAEGQIVDILEGKEFENVWRKEHDPGLTKQYSIRQAQYRCEMDGITVGCRNKCYFCLYTWIRKYYNFYGIDEESYRSHYQSIDSTYSNEDTWNDLKLDKRFCRYVVGIDGLSEETRLRVNKHITDGDIEKKLDEIYSSFDFQPYIELKLYQIIGYPWETTSSVVNDLHQFIDFFYRTVIKHRRYFYLNVKIQLTAFNPTPITPMQLEGVEIVNWNSILKPMIKNLQRNEHNLKIGIEKYIHGDLQFIRTLLSIRGEQQDLDLYQKILKEKQYEINTIPERIYKKIEKHPVDYLRSYTKIPRL